MKRDRLTEYAIELQSLAQAGLHYGKDIYDRERYERIREIAAEIISMKTELPLDTVTGMFCSDSGYQTPKVDTRSAIFRDGKILLVHEENGTWSLPGGWCEVTMSPAENAVKETKEEAGLDVAVKSVIAVQNRDFHNLPPYAYGVVKIFYLCDELGGEFAVCIRVDDGAAAVRHGGNHHGLIRLRRAADGEFIFARRYAADGVGRSGGGLRYCDQR